MEDPVQGAVLNAPVANQLGVRSAKVDLLIGQFKKSSILVWMDAVGAKLIKGLVSLLGTSRKAHTRLQSRRKRAESHRSEPGCPSGQQEGLQT